MSAGAISKRVRTWCFTEWDEKQFSSVVEMISTHKGINYAIVALEQGADFEQTGEYHLQGFVEWKEAKTFLACKKQFRGKSVHLETMRGTKYQAGAYIFDPRSIGKDKDAGEIMVEVGDRPIEGAKSAWDYILGMLHADASDYEIMMKYPNEYAKCNSAIGRMRMVILSDKLNEWRDVEVEYHWGISGSGKTRKALESVENRQDVFRITDYKNPFDSYNGQKTILFEEFRSSLRFDQILNYLDGYICELPCRYANKISNWNRVIFCTNIPIDAQYANVQMNQPLSWPAFLRRIDSIVEHSTVPDEYK